MNQISETINEALRVINDREERDGNKVLLAIVNILEARISYSTGTEDRMKAINDYNVCPYCQGPHRCKKCGITCSDAGGLTQDGLCAGCSKKINNGG